MRYHVAFAFTIILLCSCDPESPAFETDAGAEAADAAGATLDGGSGMNDGGLADANDMPDGGLFHTSRFYVENGSHDPLVGDLDPTKPPLTMYGAGINNIDIFDWNFVNGSYPCASTPCVETVRYEVPVPSNCTVIGAAAEVRASNTIITRRLLDGSTMKAEQTTSGALSFAAFIPAATVKFEYAPARCIDTSTDCMMTVYSQYVTVSCPD